MEITKTFTCDTAHRLKDHPGLCKNIHGHTYRIDVTFSGPENEQGMVKDFGEIKKDVGDFIDMTLDHALVLQHDDPLVAVFKDSKDIIELKLRVMDLPPTAETFARMIAQEFSHRGCIQVRVWETPTAYAEWRYGRDS